VLISTNCEEALLYFGTMSNHSFATRGGMGVAPKMPPVYSPPAASVNPTPSESPLRSQGGTDGAWFVDVGMTSYKQGAPPERKTSFIKRLLLLRKRKDLERN